MAASLPPVSREGLATFETCSQTMGIEPHTGDGGIPALRSLWVFT